MTGKPLVKTNVAWTLPYLQEKLKEAPFTLDMVVGPNCVFEDYRENHNQANYKWERPYLHRPANFSQFVSRYNEIQQKDNGSRIYMRVRAP